MRPPKSTGQHVASVQRVPTLQARAAALVQEVHLICRMRQQHWRGSLKCNTHMQYARHSMPWV